MPIVKFAPRAMIITLALSGTTAAMASEEKYPAYDFQPSVIFSDAELIAKLAGATASVPKPAAAAAPAPVQAAAPAAPAVEADPKYPAAHFSPSVIYPAN